MWSMADHHYSCYFWFHDKTAISGKKLQGIFQLGDKGETTTLKFIKL